jgi:hypothetical protein
LIVRASSDILKLYQVFPPPSLFKKERGNNMRIDQKDLHKPGTDNLPPGVYKEVGPRGGKITGSKEVHIVEGHRNKWIKKD